MAIPNPKDFTYLVAKDIQGMLNSLRNLQTEYSDIIEVTENEQLFYFHDKTQRNFYFMVSIPDKKSKGEPTLFALNYAPFERNTKNSYTAEVNRSEVVENFYHWINILKDFNSVNFNQEEDFLKFYEEEIFAEFEIIDEDAEIKPFDTNQQVILYKFLDTTASYLEKEYPNNEIIKDIIDDANSLKDDIPLLTKRLASKRFSKILAKIRKFNPITFKEVHEVAKKEVIKYLLLKGVETLPKLVNSITHLLGS